MDSHLKPPQLLSPTIDSVSIVYVEKLTLIWKEESMSVIKEARKFGNTEERGKILGLKGQFLTRGVGCRITTIFLLKFIDDISEV